MKLKVKCLVCGVALLILFISVRIWNAPTVNVSYESNKLEQVLTTVSVPPEREVSLVFRYTHETSKYLPETVNSFIEKFPFMPIILVSDTSIPAEVINRFSNSTNIKYIPLKIDLLKLIDRNVVNYITTKYVFLAPNNVFSLLPNEMSRLIKALHFNKKEFIAVPVQQYPFKCLRLKLNLLQWTIEYSFKELNSDCDSVASNHGIFTHTKTLQKIQEPFMLPFPEAFYIQSTALKMKVRPIHSISLKSEYEIPVRMDLIQKHQVQKQLMYKQFRIKKVMRGRGVTEWYGCTRTTPRCFPDIVNSVPDYLNQGRWTPPCCLKVLRETVHHVFKVLRDWNVTFWLEGGSLLGALRNKDIIPWDYDVDIGVYLDEINRCPWLRAVNEGSFKPTQLPSIVDNEGFVWEQARPEEGDFYRVQASEHNRLHVDIFPFYARNGIVTKKTWFHDHPQDKQFPEHYLKPLTTIEFAGIEAPAPNNIKEFLEFKFGKGCVENPQYPNPKLFPFPESAKASVVNESYNYDLNLF